MTRLLLAACLALSFSASASAAEATYRVEAPKTLKVKKGVQASARVSVVPREGSHVSPDAPISVDVSATPHIEVPHAKLGRHDAKETAQKGVAFDIPILAMQEGTGAVDANLVFFICTEKLCERRKEHVQLAVLAE
jgi:hypothetical protein